MSPYPKKWAKPNVTMAPSRHLDGSVEKVEELSEVPVQSRRQVTEMSLDEFSRLGLGLKLKVPWFGESIWLVSERVAVSRLSDEGVPRGAIWTAKEAKDLLSVGMTTEDVIKISRLRLEFNADISEIRGHSSS